MFNVQLKVDSPFILKRKHLKEDQWTNFQSVQNLKDAEIELAWLIDEAQRYFEVQKPVKLIYRIISGSDILIQNSL